jgi:hypothetical protein
MKGVIIAIYLFVFISLETSAQTGNKYLKFRTDGYYYSVDSTFGYKTYETFVFLNNDSLFRLDIGYIEWSPFNLKELDSIMIVAGYDTIRSESWSKYTVVGNKIQITVVAGSGTNWIYNYTGLLKNGVIELKAYEISNTEKGYYKTISYEKKHFFRPVADIPVPHRRKPQ